MLTAEQILIAPLRQLERRVVHVPEWGGDVLLQEWSGVQRGQWEENYLLFKKTRLADMDDDSYFWAYLVASAMVDASGARIIRDDQVMAFAETSGRVIRRLGEIAARMNGIGSAIVADVEKNSEPAPSD